MKIIPAIDIIDGKCVRLTQGDYDQKVEYADSPIDVARCFEKAGLTHLHVVDLEGAKASQPINLPTLIDIITNTALKVDFGGGVKSNESINRVLETGVSQVTAGSIAVKNPDLVKEWFENYYTGSTFDKEFDVKYKILFSSSKSGKPS